MTDQASSKIIYRVAGIPAIVTAAELGVVLLHQTYCTEEERQNTRVDELALAPSCYDTYSQVAFVRFSRVPGYLVGRKQRQILVGSFRLNIDTHFEGFTQLYPTVKDRKVEADIIAVTGLDGHAYGSWRGRGDLREMWLRDFFCAQFPRCRTLIYGYNSKLQNDNGFQQLEDYAGGLLQAIATVRRSYEERKRPVVFIGHSLGGVVITQALLKSEESRALKCGLRFLFRRTCAVVFLATPHRGFQVNNIMSMMNKDSSRIPLLQSIQENSGLLVSNCDSLISRLTEYKIPSISCYEQQQSQELERGPDGRPARSGAHYTALTRDAACLNIPGDLETKIPVDKNHSEIAKFESRHEIAYVSLISHLERCIDTACGFHDCRSLDCVTKHGNETAFMQMCVEGLVDINKCDSRSSSSLLQQVALTSFFALAECLIALGANSSGRAMDGYNALHLVARGGNSTMAKIFVQQLPVDERNGKKNTALHIAASFGNTPVLHVLLGAGANIDERDHQGRTALHYAVANRFVEGVNVLLQAGSSSDTIDGSGFNLLHSAVHARDLEIFKILLKRGGNIDDCNLVGLTALHRAASRGQVEMVGLLLQAGASTKPTPKGHTVLHMAVRSGNLATVKIILRAGADVFARNQSGNMPLHVCRTDTIARALLENGAPIEAQDSQGKTALQWATSRGNVELANTLVEFGALGSTSAQVGIVMAGRRLFSRFRE